MKLNIMIAAWMALCACSAAEADVQAFGEYVRLQFIRVHLSGASEQIGNAVEVREGKRVLGRGIFTAEGTRAAASITIPMPPRSRAYRPLGIYVEGKQAASLTLPDPKEARSRAFQEIPLQFERAFGGSRFPEIEFAAPGWIERLIGPYTLETAFYDAACNPVTSAEKPGRYGAIVKIKAAGGKVFEREETLYRLPEPVAWRRLPLPATLSLPKELGIDPAVAAEQSSLYNEHLSRRYRETLASDSESGMLLAGLYETKAGDPAVSRNSSWERNRRWWYGLHLKLGAKPYRYLLHLPKGYDQGREKRWPAILFLHGAGERGSNLERVKVHGPPKIAPQRDDFPFIVISPQCPENECWLPVQVMDVLDEVCAKHRVDPDRIYLTGLSMGGYGTWSASIEYPDRFAAIAPICGGGDPADAGRIRHLPIWVFHGGKDDVVPIEGSRAMVEALKKLGTEARFTIYPEAGHDSWTESYDNPELYSWFLSHRRGEK